MCHNPFGMQSAQIEKFVEQGMPQKIVKTLQYTLKKRSKEQYRKEIESRVTLLDADTDTASTSSSSANFVTSIQNPNSSTITAETQVIVSSEKLVENTEITQKSSSMLKIPKLCGRLRQLQQVATNLAENTVSNLSGTDGSVTVIRSSSKDFITNERVYVDALAVVTQLTKQFAQRLNNHIEKVQGSKIYTLLTKTTQPAHLIAICILSFVLLTVWPDIIDGTHNEYGVDDIGQKGNIGAGKRNNNKNNLAVIAYLGAFATHFGAQIWMTFVSGLSLYFSLPRHTFGQCQQILFPKYFALNAVLSVGMLILFVKYFLRSWNVSTLVQLGALSLTAVIEVIVRLYLAPPMLRLMHEKYRIEGAIGSGREVGTLVQGDLVQCPHYQRIHKAFRRIHMTIAMGNMTVLLATCLHLYFLASKIQIS